MFIFFSNDTATTEIYTILFVGSVRCVQETGTWEPTIIKKNIPEKKQIPEVKLFQGDLVTKQVSQKLQHCNFEKELFCVRFDPEDQKIATSYSDGDVFIFNLATGKIESVFDSDSKTPTSCLRWKPIQPQLKIKNILLYSNSDGSLYQVHTSSGKML
eukprot:TRINITY_DN10997_c0_g1_i1.p3 TRINITY_DN10997_c0_g1~~TRINITY_DN10997_c0_g1_i1.p3  ORF type:complete len:157 (-),score=32.28 TRINITY_DN10997_c0_g1_i1:206-676(-)